MATPVAGVRPWPRAPRIPPGVNLRGIDTVTIGTVIDLLQNIEVGKIRVPR